MKSIRAMTYWASVPVVLLVGAHCAAAPIHDAVSAGDLKRVQEISRHDPSLVSLRDPVDGRVPIHLAARLGHKQIVDYLLANGAKIDICIASWLGMKEFVAKEIQKDPKLVFAKTYAEATPLHFAVWNGQREVAELLLKAKADANAFDRHGGISAFQRAVGRNDIPMVKLLLEFDADVHGNKFSDRTPLDDAANWGYKEMVELLLMHKAKVNAKTEYGWTPLHSAANANRAEVIKVLLDHGGEINAKNDRGETPLECSVMGNKREAAELLVARGAEIDFMSAVGLGKVEKVAEFLKKDPKLANKPRPRYFPMELAAERGHIAVLEVLVANKADVNAGEVYGVRTPLHIAAGYGQTKVVEWLIKHNANVNAKIRNGSTPLIHAVYQGYFPIVKLLVENGADPNTLSDRGKPPLWYAIRHKEIVKYLLAHKADLRQHVRDTSLLAHAVGPEMRKEDWEVLDVLLAHEKAADEVKEYGHQAVCRAAHFGYKDLVTKLIAMGANVEGKMGHGLRALHLASRKGHKDIIEVLIKHSADVNATDDKEMTPLHHAAEKGQKGAVELLAAHNGDVNAADFQKRTPLHYAAENGHKDVVFFLLSLKPDVNAKDLGGLTPLSLAVKAGKKDVGEVLRRHGAKE